MKRKNSLRKRGWNYTQKATYHVTIVVRHRTPIFGTIVDESVQLNELGRIADQQWRSLVDTFDHIELGEHIIMPDHVHAILHIGSGKKTLSKATFKSGPIQGSLSHIIRVFKGYACREIRTLHPQFEWQRGFYDQHVKNKKALEAIEVYIRENPIKCHKKRVERSVQP